MDKSITRITYQPGHPRLCPKCQRQINIVGSRTKIFVNHKDKLGAPCQNSGQPLGAS